MRFVFAFVAAAAGFAVAVPFAAEAQWVDGKGGSCEAACASIGRQAMSTGQHPNGRPYTICAADIAKEGFRPGYNLEPSWSKGCFVAWGGKEVASPDYGCLCEAPRQAEAVQPVPAPAPPPAATPPRPPAVAAAPPPPAPTPPAPPAGPALTASSFKAMSYEDITQKETSGCSFSLSRGKQLLALFDIQDPKKTAVFKIDGKLVYATATGRKDKSVYWAGTVAGHEIRMIKGRVDPSFKSDGGGQGGEGRLEWTGPTGSGFLPAQWSEGC